MTGRSRSGVTMHILAALLLSGFILGIAAYLRSNRVFDRPPLLLQLKADYQMESGLVMLFQKVKQGQTTLATDTNTFQPQQQLIAPGLVLHLLSTPIDSNAYRLEARVEGEGLKSHLVAKAEHAPTGNPGAEAAWRLVYQHP